MIHTLLMKARRESNSIDSSFTLQCNGQRLSMINTPLRPLRPLYATYLAKIENYEITTIEFISQNQPSPVLSLKR